MIKKLFKEYASKELKSLQTGKVIKLMTFADFRAAIKKLMSGKIKRKNEV